MTPATLRHLRSPALSRALFYLCSACYLLGGVPISRSQDSAKAVKPAKAADSAKAVASAPADSAKPRSPEQLESLAVQKASREDLERAALSEGMRTLWDDGLAKVAAGLTSVEELARVSI